MPLDGYHAEARCCGNCAASQFHDTQVRAYEMGLRPLEGTCEHPYWDTCPASAQRNKIHPGDGLVCRLWFTCTEE